MFFFYLYLVSPNKKIILELNDLPAPSEYAKPNTRKSCTKDLVPINHHRPQRRSDIPIQFYHETFDKFLRLVKEYNQQNEGLMKYKDAIEELVPTLSEFLEDEEDNHKELCPKIF